MRRRPEPYLLATLLLFALMHAGLPRLRAQGSEATKIRGVASLPSTCKTSSGTTPADAVVMGGVLYICTATNTWTAVGGPFLGPSPWYDATNSNYGHLVHRQYSPPTMTATTTANSPNVTLASALDFVNGDGVVIWKAGAATTQSTPAAPTVTSTVVQGSRTINYKVVGYDAMGGLTAASAVGTVTNAPKCMGNMPVTITDISQSSGTVTVTTSPAVGGAVNGKVYVFNTTGIKGANGLHPISSVNGSQFTFALAGNAGSGGVSGATAQLTNTFAITAMSRRGTTISITTDQAHGFRQQNVMVTNNLTLALVLGSANEDFGGYYPVLTASGTSLTLDSGISSTERSVGLGSVQVWEYITVAGPALSGTTQGYYVYADYANNGTYMLIGKTLPGFNYFIDYGPFLGGGFRAPAYVPTTPPTSAQNQMFASTISSGGGATTITLAANVPSSVTNQTMSHDDGIIIQNIAQLNNSNPKTILLPPIQAGAGVQSYNINSPITIPSFVNLIIGGTTYINETMTLQGGNKIRGDVITGYGAGTPQFSSDTYMSLSGLASPMLYTTSGATELKNIGLQLTQSNGQVGLFATNSTSGGFLERVAWLCGNNSTTIGAWLAGNSWVVNSNLFTGAFGSNNTQRVGQGLNIQFGPPLPTLRMEGNDQHLTGSNNFFGRGIEMGGIDRSDIYIYEFQAPSAPAIWTYGRYGAFGLHIRGVIADSMTTAVFANFAYGTHDIFIEDTNTSPGSYSTVTGSQIPGLHFNDTHGQTIGQNVSMTEDAFRYVQPGGGLSWNAWPYTTLGWNLVMSGPNNPSIAWGPLPSPTQNLTATVLSGGSWLSGTFTNYFKITSVDWHGAASVPAPGVYFPSVTSDGTKKFQFTWTPVAGAQGYQIYGNVDVLQAYFDAATYCSATTCTATLNNYGANGSILPYVSLTGSTVIDKNQVATPMLRLGGHLNTMPNTGDFDGTIAITGATSGSHRFATAFTVAPVCTVDPVSDPTAVGVWWVTATKTAVTVNIKRAGTITFNYHCAGNPN